jgi:hypothetical protein
MAVALLALLAALQAASLQIHLAWTMVRSLAPLQTQESIRRTQSTRI